MAKRQCWEAAPIVPGRSPDRWRLDACGNVISAKLTGCEGCLCFEYDHIIPFSKGGQSVPDNCQLLQTRVNRLKGNQDDLSLDKLVSFSCSRIWTKKDELDLFELALYGDIIRDGRVCRCPSIMEQFEGATSAYLARHRSMPPCDDNK